MLKTLGILLTVAATLAATGPVGAQASPALATISGTVTVVGTPIETTVSIYHVATGRFQTRVATNPLTGRYEADVPPGEYTIFFRGTGGRDASSTEVGSIGEWYNDARDRASADVVNGLSGQAFEASADLALGAAIKISMVDAVTKEPAFAIVIIARPDGGYTYTHTDEAGMVRLHGIDAGEVRLRASGGNKFVYEWYDEGDDYDSATPVALTAGQESAITMERDRASATLTGRVTDENTGLGIEGAWVIIDDYWTSARSGDRDVRFSVARVQTDADGRYKIGRLRGAAYHVYIVGNAADHLYESGFLYDSPGLAGATPIVTIVGDAVVANVDLDYARCHGQVATIWKGSSGRVFGTEGADVIIWADEPSESGPVVIGGLGGDDIICGSGLIGELIYGGEGNDLIFGRGGADVLYGGAGDDIVRGGRGDDVIFGNRGNDVLRGGPGGDVVRGGFGDDVLYGGLGSGDECFGGLGNGDVAGGSCEFVSGVR